MSGVQWVKLSIGMFDNKKIKYLRGLPEGNNIVLIWIALLTMAGRCNANGMIFLTENIPYTIQMIAEEFKFQENTVLLALDQLERLGMITRNQDYLFISNWEKHQNIEGMDKIREQTRIRVAKHREKQRQVLLETTQKEDTSLKRYCNVTVTNGNATEEDKEKEKEIDKDNIYTVSQSETITEIIGYLNFKTGSNYRTNTDKTRKHIKARLNEGFTLEDFKTVIDKKVAEWLNDEKMQKYLRPETLFGTKFEGYLNERCSKPVKEAIQPAAEQNDLDGLF